MEFTLEDVTKVMDELGITYVLNSPTPGVCFKDGTIHSFDEMLLPSQYFADLDLMAEYERQLLASLEEEA